MHVGKFREIKGNINVEGGIMIGYELKVKSKTVKMKPSYLTHQIFFHMQTIYKPKS